MLASVPLIIDWNEDGSAANAATYNWNLLNVDNFSLDSNKIQVTQGAANLKKLDQTDNDNSLSGFGAGDFAGTQWSEAAGGLILTPEGLQAGSGSFTSRILDAGAPVAWSALSVSPAAPFGKELPDGGLSENGYSTGNANMTGNTALLHFNEDDGSANFADSSSLSNNGSCAAGKCPAAASGVFGNAAHFDGLDDYVDIGTADNLALGNNFTIEAWINPEDMGNYRTIASKAGSFFFAQANVGGSLRIATYFFGLKYATWQAANDSIPLYSWSHVAITFDGTNIRFYVNGKLSRQANNPGSVTSPGGNSVFVGSRSDLASKAYKFKGGIDEAAIYNRVLTTEELSARYRRGAVKWNLQARSCANADCAGAVFVGPDGTAGSYYSEGQNSTSSTPSFGLVTAPAARYFQYSLQLQTTTSSPAINAVSVLPDHFYADAPAIVPQSSSALAYSSALLGFSAAESGAGRVYYQLTNNADAVSPTWYFWNGSSWTAAVNPTDYNTSSTINEAITSFHTQLGSGNFSWRAFLTSSGGADPVGLSWVSVAYNQPPLAPEALYAGSTQAQSGATNPTDISSATPHFSGVYQDNDPVAEGTKARIQVSVDPTFSSVTHWDSGEVGAIIAPTATSTRIADIVYGSFGAAPLQPLSLDDGQITYYWRLQLGDDHSFGPFSQGGFFTLLDKPSAPASMSASRTNDTFLLNWQDLSTNEDSFVVERADDTGSGQGDWIVVATLPANATSYHDTATRASAQYWYRVMAANQAGSSEPATDNVSHYTTPAAPTNVFAQYGPDSAFSVNYTAVGAVENIFSVERCVNADCDNSAYTPVLGSPFSSSPQIDNLVSPNSRYRYRVRVGSEETTTSTFGYSDYEYTPPSAPTGVQAQYVSDDRIQLTWQDTSGYESGFVVYAAEDGGEYQAVSSTAAYTVGQNVAAYTYVLGAKDHSYKFKIRAYIGGTSANPELFSADSNETEVVYTSPSAPVMESPTVLSATSVQWNFSSSSVLAGGWRVYSLAGTVVSTLTTNSATSITEDNLSPGTCYTRRLAAFTPSSESALSSEKMACTWAQPPAGPQASSLTEGSLVLTWSTGNNSTSTEYLAVNTVTGANSGWKTENTWLVSGLSCGTQYAFNVKARNLAGVETGNSDTLTVATAACGESDTETESSGWSQSESVSIEPDRHQHYHAGRENGRWPNPRTITG